MMRATSPKMSTLCLNLPSSVAIGSESPEAVEHVSLAGNPQTVLPVGCDGPKNGRFAGLGDRYIRCILVAVAPARVVDCHSGSPLEHGKPNEAINMLATSDE